MSEKFTIKPLKPRSMWAIKSVNGFCMHWTITYRKSDAIEKFLVDSTLKWEHYKNLGYKAVRIEIFEKQP